MASMSDALDQRSSTGEKAGAGSHAASIIDKDSATLEQLRTTVDELARVAQHRLDRAARQSREAMSTRPWTTVAVAGAVGLLVAVAISRTNRVENRRITKIAGYDLPRAYQMPMPSMPNLEPLTSRLERLMDSISRIDPAALSVPALQRARDWLGNVFSSLGARS